MFPHLDHDMDHAKKHCGWTAHTFISTSIWYLCQLANQVASDTGFSARCQGVYYYFYQVFKNKAEAIAAARKEKEHGDGTVGMFSWLVVAAIAG